MAELDISVPQVWETVANVRNKVAAFLEKHNQELRDASVMVASELTENAIKYGQPVQGCAQAKFHIDLQNDKVVISVTNGCEPKEQLSRLHNAIDAINKAEDPEALYVQRLEEMLSNPADSSNQLGLIRIVHEGHFSLSYDDGQINDHILTVVATRNI